MNFAAITKNKQSEDSIRAMAAKAFPQLSVTEIKELDEGMCNALYAVTFSDGSKSVLKIASPGTLGRMSHEMNLMETEVETMRLVKERICVPLPAVQFYDNSLTLCDGAYFFMEYIEAQSMNDELMRLISQLPQEEGMNPFAMMQKLPELAPLRTRVGEIVHDIAQITGTGFGSVGSNIRYETMYDYIRALITNVFDDAAAADVKLEVEKDVVLEKLAADADIFAEVTVPRLVHQDMWEGNIMIRDGQVVGILDWERAVWGDPLMEDRFRTHSRSEEFLQGYGIKHLSPSETRRALWYDVWLFLIMMTEVTYRRYEDDRQFYFAQMLFGHAWEMLNEG